MVEINRARVPFRRSGPPQPTTTAKVQTPNEVGQTTETKAKKTRPTLDNSTAVAFVGNALTGATLDARKDLPPFGFNPAPREILTVREQTIAPTYFRPAATPDLHPSANEPFGRILDPKTRNSAKLQHLVNTNEMVRSAFEKESVTRVVRDQRADGTLTLNQGSAATGVSSQAMTGVSSQAMTGTATATGLPVPPTWKKGASLYDMLNQMDQYTIAMAASMGEQQMSEGSSGTTTPFPIRPGMTVADLPTVGGSLAGEDPDSQDGSDDGTSTGGLTSSQTQLGTNTTQPNSTDEAAQQLQLVVTRTQTMYQLVGNMMNKYNQDAMAAIKNTTG
jgi:hypothetical protein